MKKTTIALTLFVLMCSLFITSCTQPVKQKTLDRILADQTIVVGTTGEQFPFSFKDDEGKITGIDISIANHLAKELGVNIKYKVMPFNQLIPSVINGDVDIVFSGVSITTERNTKVVFPGAYYASGKSILTKDKKLSEGKKELINSEDITLAVTKATTSVDFVETKYPKAKIVLVKNADDAVALLDDNKVDGVVADYETCELLAYSYKESYLYFKNLSSATEKEFLSPIVAADDYLFINLITNYINRINTVDKYEVIDLIWYEYLN